MNSYTLYPTPAPTPFYMYDRQMNGLHIDGIFFFLLWFGSWVLFISLWAWNHKPAPKTKIHPPPSKWEMSSNGRN